MPPRCAPHLQIVTAGSSSNAIPYIQPESPSPADTIASGYSSIVSYGSSDSSRTSISSAGSPPPAPPPEFFSLPTPTTQFAVAVYHYSDPDPAILSLEKGDVLEIISKHESGWWDCMSGNRWNGYGLGGVVRRGWVPSNYAKGLKHRSEAQAALHRRAKERSGQ
ncbi:hypothetical protein FA13DRAFT_1729910 [Coprinellus micaceus]|uniref:SH3 domain-containing protein n=1 Tax=Coprinellus micaceus TaxID=71717 RepID=A0A4Y7TJP4_COPMI|nr:hypothetical protein FA13DRAFT_1729910 [Coprinellus micaceus]